MMDLRQLRYFVGVVTAGSFNKAAEQLHVAQPALSRQIKALEDDLGVQLLFRTSHGVHLTDAGQRLRELADYLLRSAENVRVELSNLTKEPAGKVVVGLPPSLSTLVAPSLIEAARRAFPNVSIHVIEGLSVFLVDWIELGKIDIAVLTDPRQGHSIERRDLGFESMVLVGTPDKFEPEKKTATVHDTDRPDVIISNGFLRVMQPWYEAAGARQRFAMELDSIPIIKSMIERGLYVTIVPFAMVHREVAAGRLRALPFANPHIQRHLILANSSRRPLTQSMVAIGDLIAAEIAMIPRLLD